MKFCHSLCLALAMMSVATPLIPRAAAEQTMSFQEVFDLLRSNLVGVTEADLQGAAAQGLVRQLSPRVLLADEIAAAPAGAKGQAGVATEVYDSYYGYIRIRQIDRSTATEITNVCAQLVSSHKLKGMIVDLRYAAGNDYAAAATVADWFISSEQPLIDWGDGLRKSTAKDDAFRLPLTLLVNRSTAGAAEAVAGMLRQCDVGLTIGTNTAGRANIAREFTLKTGQRLLVASTPVKLGDGKPMPFTGLEPDIHINVTPDDELAFYSNPFKAPNRALAANGRIAAADSSTSATTTNRTGRRRLNEAELVRMMKEGQNPDDDTNATVRHDEPSRPLVQDPSLARAIDLLKGLSVVRQFRGL